MSTCRFCKRHAAEDWLVKYGTRHYAHPDCYLKAGKKVEDLNQYQQDHFEQKHTDWKDLIERRGFR
jgi:hypothetical protein